MGLFSAITGIIGAKKTRKRIDQAVKAGVEGEQGLIDEAQRQTGVVDESFAPFVAPGKEASNILLRLLQGNNADFQESPGFRFAVDEGVDETNRQASAAGLLGSGTRLKAIADRVTGLAQQDFGNFFNRILNVAQQGQGAVTNQSSFTTGLSNRVGQGKSTQGQIRASGFLGKAKNFQNLLAGLNQSVGGIDFGGGKVGSAIKRFI